MSMKPKVFIALQVIIDQGGISTSVQNLLNEIHEKYNVTLCAVGDYISPNARIPNDVIVIKGSSLIRDALTDRALLKEQSVLHQFIRNGIRYMRRFVGMPFIAKQGVKQIPVPQIVYDAAVAFSNDIYDKGHLSVGGVYELILHKVQAKRKIAWMHNDLRKEGYDRDIALQAFKEFDAVVTVSYENKSLVDEMVPEYTDKSMVVYNTYDLMRIKEMSKAGSPYEQNGKMHFVTVARLQLSQKRQDRIIKTCGRLKKEGFSHFDWYLVGDGEREVLEQMAKENDVVDIIRFTGLQKNPYPYMKYADAFVLTSLYEGLSMTNKEAQVLETPTLITRYGAASEAVEDGKQGIICDNSTKGVYNMIKHILQHPEELEIYRKYLHEHPINNNLALRQFHQVCGFN